MPSFIPSFCFLRAAMSRMCIGLAFVGLAVAAHAVQSEEHPHLDILTIQLARSDIGRTLPYRLDASAPAWPGLDNRVRLYPVAGPQKETAWPTNPGWQSSPDRSHISLRHLLRVEFKGDMANITFGPRSVSIDGERFNIRFQPQTASLEGGRFKIMLRPRAASMLWRQTF